MRSTLAQPLRSSRHIASKERARRMGGNHALKLAPICPYKLSRQRRTKESGAAIFKQHPFLHRTGQALHHLMHPGAAQAQRQQFLINLASLLLQSAAMIDDKRNTVALQVRQRRLARQSNQRQRMLVGQRNRLTRLFRKGLFVQASNGNCRHISLRQTLHDFCQGERSTSCKALSLESESNASSPPRSASKAGGRVRIVAAQLTGRCRPRAPPSSFAVDGKTSDSRLLTCTIAKCVPEDAAAPPGSRSAPLYD